MIEDANTVDQLFAIGGLKGSAPFCHGDSGPVTFKNLHFGNWRNYVKPAMQSKFFNDGSQLATFDGIYFYDKDQTTMKGILDSAVQIYNGNGFVCVCATPQGAEQCWDAKGAGRGKQNLVYSSAPNTMKVSNIWFPFGQ